MRLLVATRSPGKQRELRPLLGSRGIEVVFPGDLGLEPESAEEAVEGFPTFALNAVAKAEYFFQRSGGIPTLADDSGLEVDALDGAPGVLSKRWAGLEGDGPDVDAGNNALLLSRLARVPPDRRTARYRCVLALVEPKAAPVTFAGTTEGSILSAPKGTGGFGYDPLFLSHDLGCTFAEARADAKHAVSHRGRALQEFLRSLTLSELRSR